MRYNKPGYFISLRNAFNDFHDLRLFQKRLLASPAWDIFSEVSSNLSFFSIVSPRAAGDGDSYHYVFKIPHYASNQIIRQLFKHSLSHTESQKRPTWRWTIQIGAVSYRKSNIPLLKKWKLCIVLRSNGNKNSSVLHNRLSNERADQHREFVASRFQQNHSKDCVKKSSETSWGMNLKLDHTSKNFSNHRRSILRPLELCWHDLGHLNVPFKP